jgi:hypothetical protein
MDTLEYRRHIVDDSDVRNNIATARKHRFETHNNCHHKIILINVNFLIPFCSNTGGSDDRKEINE